jgi:hypothetical protein
MGIVPKKTANDGLTVQKKGKYNEHGSIWGCSAQNMQDQYLLAKNQAAKLAIKNI